MSIHVVYWHDIKRIEKEDHGDCQKREKRPTNNSPGRLHHFCRFDFQRHMEQRACYFCRCFCCCAGDFFNVSWFLFNCTLCSSIQWLAERIGTPTFVMTQSTRPFFQEQSRKAAEVKCTRLSVETSPTNNSHFWNIACILSSSSYEFLVGFRFKTDLWKGA